jgi:hypothetical protein
MLFMNVKYFVTLRNLRLSLYKKKKTSEIHFLARNPSEIQMYHLKAIKMMSV